MDKLSVQLQEADYIPTSKITLKLSILKLYSHSSGYKSVAITHFVIIAKSNFVFL